MIKLFVSALVTAVAVLASDLPPQFDLTSRGLRGPVQRVESQSEESITIDGHTSQVGATKGDTLKFDRKGQLVESLSYDASGLLRNRETYSHTAAGLPVGWETFDEEGKLESKESNLYRDGKLLESRTYDEQGQITMKDVFTYGSKGLLAEVNHFWGGTLVGRTAFTIGGDGNVSEAAFFQPNGANAIAPIGPCYNAHRVSYSYDDQRRTTEETSYDMTGDIKARTTYRYDSKGNVLEEHRKDKLSTIDYLHEYEYDAHGSWTRETIRSRTSRAPLIGDKPNESVRLVINTRKITYY